MAKKIDVHTNHPFVTTYGGQVTNKFDTIMEVVPPEGLSLGLVDRVPFIVKLWQSGGSEITTDSRVQVAYKTPQMETPEGLYTFEYKVFANLTYNNQSNNRYQDRLKLDLDLGGGKDTLVLGENDILKIRLLAGEQVSFSPTGEETSIEFEMEQYTGPEGPGSGGA